MTKQTQPRRPARMPRHGTRATTLRHSYILGLSAYFVFAMSTEAPHPRPEAVVEARAVAKSFSGVQALKHADFDLRPGEIHAMVGENGAGKSTFIKIVTGALTPDRGTLRIDGHDVAHNTPNLARSLGVRVIYQQPSLFPQLTVAENIALGLETGGLWRMVDWSARRRQATDLLARAGSAIHPDRTVDTLSMPEQQVVEIAKAIGARAKVLILDEPTASLSDREVQKLFSVIRALRDEGVGLIYISHRLEEVAAISDRVTVLRDGQTIATRNMADVDRPELIRLMVGRDLSAVFPQREHIAATTNETVLETRDLSSKQLRLDKITIAVERGEILGIAGLVGSGRTELAGMLFGLDQPDSGAILLRGKEVKLESPADAIRHRIAYIPEDRRQHGVVLDMPVTANVSMASLASVSKNGLIKSDTESVLATDWTNRLRIKTSSIAAPVGQLSGGNQQKVAIARWLATEPEVLILDEPTQGVDIGSKSEIHDIVNSAAARGCAVIMISSELPEILGMSDRIAVMHEGAIAGTLTREEATQEKVLALAMGQS